MHIVKQGHGSKGMAGPDLSSGTVLPRLIYVNDFPSSASWANNGVGCQNDASSRGLLANLSRLELRQFSLGGNGLEPALLIRAEHSEVVVVSLRHRFH